MNSKIVNNALALLFPFIVSTTLLGQTEKQLRLHTPGEILKIMEESELSYVIGELTDEKSESDSLIVHHNQLFFRDTADKRILDQYKLSERALQLLQEGDREFVEKNFGGALKNYKQLLAVQPEYSFALTMIGDAHYSIDNYDSAKIYFQRAIERNFIDYSAHWFLADTYDKLGITDSALREITIAHLLNPNHADLKQRMREYRETSSRDWQEWEFKPLYQLSSAGNRILINTSPGWVAYAMVKAVWKYEPGYAYRITANEPDTLLVNWSEEKEAVLALLSDTTRNQRISEIIAGGYFEEFILYELTAKKYSVVLLLLPSDNFWRVYDYVEKYH